MTTVQVINGPNLGRLGHREPGVYGNTTHEDLVALVDSEAAELGLKAVVRQTDSKAELLGWIHAAADAGEPVVLNAGALTHTSVALLRRVCRAAGTADRGAHLQCAHPRRVSAPLLHQRGGDRRDSRPWGAGLCIGAAVPG